MLQAEPGGGQPSGRALRAGQRRPGRRLPPGQEQRQLAGLTVPELTAELGRPPTVIVTLSGRGDKDMATAGHWFGLLEDEKAIG